MLTLQAAATSCLTAICKPKLHLAACRAVLPSSGRSSIRFTNKPSYRSRALTAGFSDRLLSLQENEKLSPTLSCSPTPCSAVVLNVTKCFVFPPQVRSFVKCPSISPLRNRPVFYFQDGRKEALQPQSCPRTSSIPAQPWSECWNLERGRKPSRKRS
jgi:hypothetical protein